MNRQTRMAVSAMAIALTTGGVFAGGVKAEELKATGTISASCAPTYNDPGVLVPSGDLRTMSTKYGSQPNSIKFGLAVSAGATVDYSTPATLLVDGNDMSDQVVMTEEVSYQDSFGNETKLVNPQGLIVLVASSNYDFSQDLAIAKADGSELPPGDYEYTKFFTCTGGFVQVEVPPDEEETPPDEVTTPVDEEVPPTEEEVPPTEEIPSVDETPVQG